MSLELQVIDVGRRSYADAWKIQEQYLGQRMQGEIPDTLLLVEHDPTISLGTNTEWNTTHCSEKEITQAGVTVVRSKRGGGAAYLGPGQLVGYTIMDVTEQGGVLPFMQALEEIMIRTAGDFGIPIQRHDTKNPTTDKPYRATWHHDQKTGKYSVLCTKGIGVQWKGGRLYSHHGFALHVNREEPSYFHFIDPCGFPASEIRPIAMSEILGKNIDMNRVKAAITKHAHTILKGIPYQEVVNA